MSRLENWGDLFKYSKELLDDDYNHGQYLVVKTKNKAAGEGNTVSNKKCDMFIGAQPYFKGQLG